MPGGFIGEDQVRRVREAVDLVAAMGEYTNVKRAGGHHVACCPFHSERTPSLHIYDDGHYHCYGCGAHGDVITLVKEKEHLEFTDAMELLARRAGIELRYERGGDGRLPRSERDSLVETMEWSTRFYEQVLWSTPAGAEARAYLTSRALSEATCREFRLGWAPGNSALVEEARRRGIEIELLIRNDLAVDRGGRWNDRFFERVTFPICDRFGNVAAFSARLLPAAERRAKEEGRGVGKYVNSTDTPLYHKGATVFNLHRARGPAKDKGRLLVMEGPTDVMAAHQAGFTECVAVLGTALTGEHAKQLGGLTSGGGQLLLVLDGDRAGQANSLKAIRTCLAVGVPCRVAVIPDEMDPAELLADAAGGPAAFERVLASARTDLDHYLRVVAPRPYGLDRRALLALVDQILDALRPLPDRELLGLYLRDASNYLNVDLATLERRLAEGGPRPVAAPSAGSEAVAAAADLPELGADHEVVLHLLVRCPELRTEAFDRLGIEPSWLPPLWRTIVDHLVQHPDADSSALRLLAEDPAMAPMRPALFRWLGTSPDRDGITGSQDRAAFGDGRTELTRAAHALRLGRLREDLGRLRQDLRTSTDFATSARIGGDVTALLKQISDITGQSGMSG